MSDRFTDWHQRGQKSYPEFIKELEQKITILESKLDKCERFIRDIAYTGYNGTAENLDAGSLSRLGFKKFIEIFGKKP